MKQDQFKLTIGANIITQPQCEKDCSKHLYTFTSKNKEKDNESATPDFTVSLCPQFIGDTPMMDYPYPVYSNDKQYNTNSFILGIDRRSEYVQINTDYKRQLQAPSDYTPRQLIPKQRMHCSVCDLKYSDYFQHNLNQQQLFFTIDFRDDQTFAKYLRNDQVEVTDPKTNTHKGISRNRNTDPDNSESEQSKTIQKGQKQKGKTDDTISKKTKVKGDSDSDKDSSETNSKKGIVKKEDILRNGRFKKRQALPPAPHRSSQTLIEKPQIYDVHQEQAIQKVLNQINHGIRPRKPKQFSYQRVTYVDQRGAYADKIKNAMIAPAVATPASSHSAPFMFQSQKSVRQNPKGTSDNRSRMNSERGYDEDQVVCVQTDVGIKKNRDIEIIKKIEQQQRKTDDRAYSVKSRFDAISNNNEIEDYLSNLIKK